MTLICIECGETSEDGEGWKGELASIYSIRRSRTRSRSTARSAGRVSSATCEAAVRRRGAAVVIELVGVAIGAGRRKSSVET
jgi:hypothetical protein